MAGTLVVHNAEVLAGIVLAQLTNPGVPSIYGSSTSTFDMKYGTATVGAPEFGMLNAALAEMAHYYEVPVTVGGFVGGLEDRRCPERARENHYRVITRLGRCQRDIRNGDARHGHDTELSAADD